MNEFLCIFCPSFFGLALLHNMNRGKNSYATLVINYFINVLLVNLVLEFIMIKLFNVTGNISDSLTNFPGFACKYIVFGVILSFIIAIITHVISKNISFKVEVEENGKKKK